MKPKERHFLLLNEVNCIINEFQLHSIWRVTCINYDMTDVILIKERALCDNYIDTSRLGYGVYVTGSWVE